MHPIFVSRDLALALLIVFIVVATIVYMVSAHDAVQPTEIKDLYAGTTTLDRFGEATIAIAPNIAAEHLSFTYQVLGSITEMPGLFIKSQLSNNEFTVSGGEPGGQIAWEPIGHRPAHKL